MIRGSMDALQPAFAVRLSALMDRLRGFGVFEAYRSPERQARLYAKGRTAPGGIVTRAKPWQSYHQYGLAADIVLRIDGIWSWSTKGDLASRWRDMRRAAVEVGLRVLDSELPHVEFPWTLERLRAGDWPEPFLPARELVDAVLRSRSRLRPKLPPFGEIERPAMTELPEVS